METKRRTNPAALVVGFSTGRRRNIRHAQRSSSTGTPQAAKPTRAYSAAEREAPKPPIQLFGEAASPPAVIEKRLGSRGSCERSESAVRTPTRTRRTPRASLAIRPRQKVPCANPAHYRTKSEEWKGFQIPHSRFPAGSGGTIGESLTLGIRNLESGTC